MAVGVGADGAGVGAGRGAGLGWGDGAGAAVYGDYFSPYGDYYTSAYPAYAYGYNYPDEGTYLANPDGQYAVASPPAPNAGDQCSRRPATSKRLPRRCNITTRPAPRFSRATTMMRCAWPAMRASSRRRIPKCMSCGRWLRFAAGDYLGAATEAHAALALGKPSTWADLYSYYNDNDKYTEQLRKLEKTVAHSAQLRSGTVPAGLSVLDDRAPRPRPRQHFALAAKLTPNDKLAAHILKQLNAGSEVTPPELPKPPAAGAGQPQAPPAPQPQGKSI